MRKKLDIDRETSTNVQGISNILTVFLVLLAILAVVIMFLASQDGNSEMLGITFMVVQSLCVITIPSYIIIKRLIKGFAKIVEASESITEYIDYINEQKEEKEIEK